MPKKKIAKKPKEILVLEEKYGITIGELPKRRLHLNDYNGTYELNDSGELVGLRLSHCNIRSIDFLIETLEGIKTLKKIDLSGNYIENIDKIFFLEKLESLDMSYCLIENFSPLKNLKNLKELFLSENNIKDLSFLTSLINLEHLDLDSNLIEDISFVSNLKKMRIFYAGGNYLTDITALKDIISLNEIRLSNNKITDIDVIFSMPKIRECNFANNRISDVLPKNRKKVKLLIDEFFYQFIYRDSEDSSIHILLSGNPITLPPISVINQGSHALDSYYENINLFDVKPLNEGRVILIGEGSSGKSSLVKRVLLNQFNDNELQTNGIKIDQWHLPYAERNLLFNIWDFGGQEIQHAVHKFFFTSGCLYVLVLDNRKEEEPEYWLQQIESLGGSAPVLVVFNKSDENKNETSDRKLLKEKYPNIVGFYNTSCKTGQGIVEFKKDLEKQAVNINSINDQFPGNWFNIKKSIEEMTSQSQHYLTYETYKAICSDNHVTDDETQKLLLQYFTTIGSITWFGDTYLNFLQLLNPVWITQGVYKIITGTKTARLLGQIHINDFKELLYPENSKDYDYDEKHYGYILSLMKKFDLCYTENDQRIQIPSAFGKEPKIEYSDFKGAEVKTYILQFKDYLPVALIHRFVARNIENAFDNNYWYSGIVLKDMGKSETLTMVHADKEAKRIYVRIKGENKLPMWERVRDEFHKITSNYSRVIYSEQLIINDTPELLVEYQDLINHLRAGRGKYFHAKQMKEYAVRELIGWFETKETTINKVKKDLGLSQQLETYENDFFYNGKSIVIKVENILNQNQHVEQHVDININIQQEASGLLGDANYLLNELKDSNQELSEALKKIMEFAQAGKIAKNQGEIVENGWGRQIKKVIKTLSNAGEQLKNIDDGKEALLSIFNHLYKLGRHFQLKDIEQIQQIIQQLQ